MSSVSSSSSPILHQVKEMKKTNDDIIQDAIFWNRLRSVSSRTSSSSSSHTEKSAIKTTTVVDDAHEILGKKRRKKKLRMSHTKKYEQDGYDDDDEFEVQQQPEKEPDIIMNKRKTPPKLPPRTRPKLPQLPSANSSFSSTSSQHRKTPPKLPPRKPKRDQQHIACLSPMASLGESAMKTLIFESQRSDSTKSAYQDDLEEDDDNNNSFTKPKEKKTMSKMITWISKKLNAAQLKAISILAKTTNNSSQKLLLQVEQPVDVCEEQKSVSSESQKQIKNEEDDNDDDDDAYYKHEETYQEMADLLMQMFLEDMDLEEDDDEGESTELNYSHPSSPKLSSPSYQEQKRLSRLDLSQKSILVNRLGYDSSKILLVSPEGMLREEILLNSTKRKNHDRRSIRSIKIFQATTTTTTTSSSTDLVVPKKRNARLRFFPNSSISTTNATRKVSRLFNS